ncbi:hypothetical protein F2Q69_00054769 [Brassica cretica]|uniref:Uncharacterized protein n=1 Tax=Brassica cretica TaxID=69181 RepID=A0A8S9N087_BRACR|nr:hypothetical protein F2Q69_00054769 [Brassica cretica]
MGALVHEKPCGVQGPIRLEPAASRGGCTGSESKIDRVHWDMVPWPIIHKRTWVQGSIRLRHGGTELRPWAGSGMKSLA